MKEQFLELLKNRRLDIEHWFDTQWSNLPPPFYMSVDIRHSGQKAAVIDANQYPAGFNNLCSNFSKKVIENISHFFKQYYPHVKTVALLGENHTRNKYYLKNLLSLSQFLTAAGLKPFITMTLADIPATGVDIDLDGTLLHIDSCVTNGNILTIANHNIDLIISNNDFSSGIPEVLNNITSPIIPSPLMGWHSRKKGDHFKHLQTLANDFGKTFNLDPWLITCYFDTVNLACTDDKIDFEVLVKPVDTLIEKIKLKYEEYGINDTPYVFIKNNAGTYGMGIMTVTSGAELMELNRRQKNKLLSSKGGSTIESFLIQEGVPTRDQYSGYPIEPVIYCIGKKDVGGFFRLHETKNEFESLNAPGMSFSCLCLHKLDEPHEEQFLDCQQKKGLADMAGLLARLSLIAIAMEAKQTEK